MKNKLTISVITSIVGIALILTIFKLVCNTTYLDLFCSPFPYLLMVVFGIGCLSGADEETEEIDY